MTHTRITMVICTAKMLIKNKPIVVDVNMKDFRIVLLIFAPILYIVTDLDDIDEIKTEMEVENEIEKEPDTHSPPKQAKSKHGKNNKSKNKGKKVKSANRK